MECRATSAERISMGPGFPHSGMAPRSRLNGTLLRRFRGTKSLNPRPGRSSSPAPSSRDEHRPRLPIRRPVAESLLPSVDSLLHYQSLYMLSEALAVVVLDPNFWNGKTLRVVSSVNSVLESPICSAVVKIKIISAFK
ncbi:uncharacterized protein LOC121405314 [Drosophila obscura]|uniref:uncharacterized protein LOC121405309 n=1 Tax=Drosophila obscura TaxID=7282 RepID=UPI001BB17108|nr:uncharacterized protein LOC121405309 [Drosophila obscura]XP_041451880.1 uncharacterized protein LOC121405310 [Drosophila obscura]XP_041451881.1 uncharacterized protein LOC121405310 [Drosophila obscura]XP_041451885.1 uncharacterized protein LOC121405314 [Drosophila obscura]XP_041451886.1 uncharacterized protein LOC121405314 [Drosophila obscura]